MKKEMIKQDNFKINKNPLFVVDDFKTIDDSTYVLFFYDKKISRNKYIVTSIKKTSKETLGRLTESSYRGDIKLEAYGKLPLFVLDFDYSLYGVEVTYEYICKSGVYYSKLVSPLSFKLKGKEDRLCFDSIIYEYADLNSLLKDSWKTRRHVKAKKVEIPPYLPVMDIYKSKI